MYVSSIEELDTRSMSYMRSHGAYLTSSDSRSSKNAISAFCVDTRNLGHGSDARIGRTSVARVAIDAVSMVLHRSFDAASRRKSNLLLQFDHPSGPHTNRICSSFGRMYLPRSNALRVLHAVWMGPCARRVRRVPSNRHGRAVTESAVRGTCAKASRGHFEVLNFPTVRPLGPVLPSARRVAQTSAREARA